MLSNHPTSVWIFTHLSLDCFSHQLVRILRPGFLLGLTVVLLPIYLYLPSLAVSSCLSSPVLSSVVLPPSCSKSRYYQSLRFSVRSRSLSLKAESHLASSVLASLPFLLMKFFFQAKHLRLAVFHTKPSESCYGPRVALRDSYSTKKSRFLGAHL